ncbi:MAG: sulfate ABC transporter permease subunit CysW [Richelia sp. RM2_1_2]|nr:sulfate ABC transporter permease subunit CysW [Richelia sp. SM1_7_0]NJN07925.1 sulfate ABC transporter permease subunit CysW [Richelia sp. RM1_1_1]NJO26709.1 sulfate ABC transporter permease subunit CysW [Richelia sp. SL_2_1]NJO57086.1 sulfate ABC transporter permease subunit CysW [Richelia sp. RM2_1_2]
MIKSSSQNKLQQNQQKNWVPKILIALALLYLSLVIYIPAANVFFQAFKNGVEPFLANLTEPNFLHAAWLTLILALITVPINTIFGLCAAWALTRGKIPGRAVILSVIDLPFSISPVVVGLMIVLLYGRNGWFGGWLVENNMRIIFGLPGMILATAFVSMPFVAREVIPVLDEIGKEQEEAAKTLGANGWQIFWRVTIPNVRWGLLYGVLLTNARAMGEFGAVSVVSGNIGGLTQSLPLFIEDAYKQYQTEAAFSAALILAMLALVTLVVKEILEKKSGHSTKKNL